jgi:hypothetical protein
MKAFTVIHDRLPNSEIGELRIAALYISQLAKM